jgi:hypothetical protein
MFSFVVYGNVWNVMDRYENGGGYSHIGSNNMCG